MIETNITELATLIMTSVFFGIVLAMAIDTYLK
jgi:hypothetical protein